MILPNKWTNKKMFQTTNQILYIYNIYIYIYIYILLFQLLTIMNHRLAID